MRAAVALSQNATAPLSGLAVQDMPVPAVEPGWSAVKVVTSSLNPHDVWTLRGVGHPAERIPMILGCDAAGVTEDGREVIVHPVFGDPTMGHGDITMDPGRHLLSEIVGGGLAEWVVVPTSSLVDKPEWLTFEQAAALPIAWGTAYRMLFTRAGIKAGDKVLIQGASGGVASAAIPLAKAAGATVYVATRDDSKRDFALSLGADAVIATGERAPSRVDIVVDSVGEATWSHSLKSLRPGGVIVTCGATSGPHADADLNRIFYQQLSIIGSTASTKEEFEAMLHLMHKHNLRPHIDDVISLESVTDGFQRLIDGKVLGKIVVTI